MTENKQIPTYLGVDLETTGLEPAKARIIEIAILILDEDFNELDSWHTPVRCPKTVLHGMDRAVVEMHCTSGLLLSNAEDRSYDLHPGLPWMHLAEVEDHLHLFLERFRELPILVGSSVHFDRAFMKHWVPLFESRLSHRQVDDRTIKQLAPEGGWEPSTRSDGSKEEHRALLDIRRTAANLRRAKELLDRPLYNDE